LLSDAEPRDQLITFLLAGHETTATSLSWALHELAHDPEASSRAQQAVDIPSPEGDLFLKAVVKEAMRRLPVIFQATAPSPKTPTWPATGFPPASSSHLPSAWSD